MAEYLREHIRLVEEALRKQKTKIDWKALSEFNRMQIGFFQHERLVHLLITFFFAFMFVSITIAGLMLVSGGLLIISLILLVMLIFYVWHYFILENGVQKLYRLEKEIQARASKKVS
jgi:fatty acid desaturase